MYLHSGFIISLPFQGTTTTSQLQLEINIVKVPTALRSSSRQKFIAVELEFEKVNDKARIVIPGELEGTPPYFFSSNYMTVHDMLHLNAPYKC